MRGFEIKNITDISADLYVTGVISDDEDKNWFASDDDGNINGYVFPVDIKNQLAELKGKTLNVYINSVGGTVMAGTAIANMLARHDGQTNAFIDGLAASSATSIFFACDTKNMPSNAYLMIHKPSSGVIGNADDFLREADALDTIQRGMESTYIKNAKDGVTADQISNLVNSETWLTGAEAAKIFNINVTDPLKMVACTGKLPANIKNMPKNIRFIAQKQLSDNKKLPIDNKINDKKLMQKQKNDITIALAMADIL